jgi:hypothetical protein
MRRGRGGGIRFLMWGLWLHRVGMNGLTAITVFGQEENLDPVGG